MQTDDDGVRELKPIQFFGNDGSGAFNVDRDFRPGVTKDAEEPVADEITHTFQAEPGEPGVPEQADAGDSDEPEFEEEPMSLLDDAPPVEPTAEATAESEEEITAPEAQTAEE